MESGLLEKLAGGDLPKESVSEDGDRLVDKEFE